MEILTPIINFLLTNYPAFIWMAAGGLLVWVFMKTQQRIEKGEEKTDNLIEKIEKLPCPKHNNDIQACNNNHALVTNSITEIQTSIKFMQKNAGWIGVIFQQAREQQKSLYSNSKSAICNTSRI